MRSTKTKIILLAILFLVSLLWVGSHYYPHSYLVPLWVESFSLSPCQKEWKDFSSGTLQIRRWVCEQNGKTHGIVYFVRDRQVWHSVSTNSDFQTLEAAKRAEEKSWF